MFLQESCLTPSHHDTHLLIKIAPPDRTFDTLSIMETGDVGFTVIVGTISNPNDSCWDV